jgi:hypothetical protein
MNYVIIRRYGDDREDERFDWNSHGQTIRVVGDAWHVAGEGLRWRVTRVTAGDDTGPAAIVLEPFGE